MSGGIELRWTTPREWAGEALREPLALLADHACCELGAAAAAQGLLARKPDEPRLVERLAAHAAEELRHFRQVHRLLVELGGTLGYVRRNPYAEGLLAHVRRGPAGLVDRLLVFGLIERRSLERFQCLAGAAAGRHERLAALYSELAPSEEGHAALFLELARERVPPGELAESLRRWSEREARQIANLPFTPSIHSGPPLVGTARTVATVSAV